MAKNESLLGTCYLCGISGKMTREHIPAKGLFEKPRPSNLVTVPCCFKCNNQYSKDDEYFRLAVSAAINVNGKGRSIWENAVPRTIQRKIISGLVADFNKTLRPISIKMESGNINGIHYTMDEKILRSVLMRITKGFLSIAMPDVERNDLEFEFLQINQFKTAEAIIGGGFDELCYHFSLGDGVYSYWSAIDKDNHSHGIWLHLFYGAACWIVTHNRKQQS
jgi:hypothetical protein